METQFQYIINFYKENGLDVTVEVVGIIRQFTDLPITVRAGSTDANIFLSHGIPSNVIGTAIGRCTHTREEWILTESLVTIISIELVGGTTNFYMLYIEVFFIEYQITDTLHKPNFHL